jgi:hypothetical protein
MEDRDHEGRRSTGRGPSLRWPLKAKVFVQQDMIRPQSDIVRGSVRPELPEAAKISSGLQTAAASSLSSSFIARSATSSC